MLNFPDAPTNGAVFTSAGKSWVWDTVKWGATGVAAVIGDPVLITHGGTSATAAPQALINLGAVAKAGDTMSGRLGINDASGYPIAMISPSGVNCSISYLVTAVRQWACGISAGNGSFYIQDITAGGAIRFEINTSGVVIAYSGINVGGAGITYTSYEGHSFAFGWNGSQTILHIDGGNQGAIAMNSTFANYLPLTGGTLSGVLTGTTINTTNLTVTGGGGCVSVPNGDVRINGAYYSAGVAVIAGNAINTGYTAIYDNAGAPNIYLGGNADQTNYHRQTTHYFQSRGATTFAAINSAGLSVTGQILATGHIGTSDTLTVSGAATINGQFICTAGGQAIFANNGNVEAAGAIIADTEGYKPGGGSWAATSDIRVKKEVVGYTRGLDAVMQLEPVAYKYNGKGGTRDDGRVFVGLVADEVEPIMPEMVGTYEVTFEVGDEKTTEVQTLNTTALTYALVNAVKELAQRLAALEGTKP